MDKNTMTGLLLMAAAFLGFMWFNQPKVDPNSRTPNVETTEAQRKAMADDMLASPSDSVTEAELSMLAAAIKQYGYADSVAGEYTLKNKNVDLRSNGKTVSGTVNVDGSEPVSVASLTGDAILAVAPQTADKAVAALKQTIRDITQYQGFARYLQGDNQTIKLENEVLSLDLSTKGAMIASAELKKYDSYRGGHVVLFDGNDDSYSFILNSSDREFDTRNFYYTPVQ